MPENALRLHFPKQRVSESTKQNKDWYRPSMDYKITEALSLTDNVEREMLLNAANGSINMDVFDYVLKPYGKITNPLFENFEFPGEVRDTGLIKDLLIKTITEHKLASHNYVVKVHNADVVIKKNKALQDQIMPIIHQRVLNRLREAGMGEGQSQEDVDIKSLVDKFKKEYVDERAIKGQHRLEAFREWTDDEAKYEEAYFSWLVLGEYYTHREVIGNRVEKNIVNTLEAFPIPNSEMYVEDYDGFLWKYRMSFNQIYDYFGEELSVEDEKYLDGLKDRFSSDGSLYTEASLIRSRLFGDTHSSNYYSNYYTDNYGDSAFAHNHMVDVYRITWMSEVKTGLLTYRNPLGMTRQKEVGEKYKLNKLAGDIEIQWKWVQAPLEGIRIGGESNGIYLPPKRMDIDRGLFNNTFKNKINYGGKRHLLRYKFNHSLVLRLLPFEIMSRIYRLAIEREINKGLISGDVLMIPRSLLDAPDVSFSENMLFIAADGKIIYDDSDPAKRELVVQGALKLVTGKHYDFIKMLIELDNKNKIDAWDSIGWNRQRDGQSFASDGKGNNLMALQQSINSIAFVNEVFDKAREKDYEADLDYLKVADIEATDDKSLGTFRTATGEFTELTINGRMQSEAIMGVYVSGSAKDDQKLKALKDFAFSAGQHGEFESSIAAINSDNPLLLEDKIRDLSAMLAKRAADEKADELKLQHQLKQEDTAFVERHEDREDKRLMFKEDAETNRTIMEIEGKVMTSSTDDGVLAGDANAAKESFQNRRQAFDEKKHYDIMRSKSVDQSLKNKQIDNSLKIAKENKNKYDK